VRTLAGWRRGGSGDTIRPVTFPDEAARLGPQPFSAFMSWALYDAHQGFYATGGSAGRRGDFLTSPEVGPLFGAVLARTIDGWWRAMGEPDPFVVVEAGAGPGTLARAVLATPPACATALRYILVERAAAQRARHHEHLPIDPAAFAFGPEDDDSPLPQPARRGPIVVSLAELPRLAGPCVVLANELLDNLPFDVWERGAGGWSEVLVDADLREVVVPSEPPDWLAALGAPPGARVPVQGAARRWVSDAQQAARTAEGGRVVTFDYCTTTAALAARPAKGPQSWLRTFRGHGRGDEPLEVPGTQDVTSEVCLDQLPPPSSTATQASWLRANGIDELVEEGRRAWHERAGVGDLAAVRMRSRVTEADALLDPDGLGGFTVVEWC
jgi:SAM-dependent MidA family methyltransferase